MKQDWYYRIKKYWLRLVIGLIIFIIFLKWTNVLDSIKYLSRVEIVYFIMALFFIVIFSIMKAIRFKMLSDSIKVKLDCKKNILVHLIAPVFGIITPARLGEGGKIFFFKEQRKELGFCYIVEKLADLVMLFVFALCGLFIFKNYISFIPLFSIFFICIVVMLLNIPKILNFILKKEAFKKEWFKDNFKKITKKSLIILMLNTFIVWLIDVVFFQLLAFSLGIKTLSLFSIMQIFGITTLVSSISGTPGGIGTKEITMSFVLINYFNINKELAGIFALITTFSLYLIFSLQSLISYIILKKYLNSKCKN